jgi:hypothetical protein
MRYAMLICGVEEEWAAQTEAELAAMMAEIGAWVGRWREAGKVAPGGEELAPVRTAKTLRMGSAGKVVVTDGPYLETKEVLGGFLVLETEDIDEAVAIAATWPDLRRSTSIEVRPVVM